jgi:16S rRNA (guanine527-N7)-methyltransferase
MTNKFEIDELVAKINVPRGTFDDLMSKYINLLDKWNSAINLVKYDSREELYKRHICDCLELIEIIKPLKIEVIADLGSGAGIPGIIMGICMQDVTMDLIESDKRKCAFLYEAVRILELKNVNVINSRIENIDKKYNLITARALSSIKTLLDFSYKIADIDAKYVFMKGQKIKNEITDALEYWNIDYEVIAGKINKNSLYFMGKNLVKRDKND